MSLLQTAQNPLFQKLANEIFNRQFEIDPKLRNELSEIAKMKMYRDVLHNINILNMALELGDEMIFEYHARWIYQLLCPLLPHCTRARVKELLQQHYELLLECLEQAVRADQVPRLRRMIGRAIQATNEECDNEAGAPPTLAGRYEIEVSQYLECLLKSDTKGAVYLISEYVKQGIPLTDVYVDIVAQTMHRVGDLWHQHQILVDKEHYCTTTTQLALSQLYPIIFRQERNGRKMLAACVGNELHEMGARMVADLFEYDGWDSVYLGAAVPPEFICRAVKEHCPELVVLSVTMPDNLILCKETVRQIQELCPDVKLAVGGNAFACTNEIWKDWRVDVYTQDARDLVAWADNTLR